MENFKIFIIEDDPWYSEILQYNLGLNPEYEIEIFTSGSEALQNLYKRPSAITLDYGLEDMSGGEVLRKIKERQPGIPVVVISAQEDIGVALKLLKEGAYDYIVKNEETTDRLWKIMINIRDHQELHEKHEELKKEVQTKYRSDSSMIGESPELQAVLKMIEKVKDSNITVSISGETGTGKEMVAKAIHYGSNRANESFIAVNVSAIPEGLIESELFGHEKGAFTGAISRKAGKFELADKGTLFLDEIAEMSPGMQTKILRVLQERELTRVGGEKPLKIDTRLIVASHKNLFEEVNKGVFREDLYYRLMGVPIEMPPLRNRGNDIIILASHFLKAFCKENNLKIPSINPGAVKKLMGYSFPGNIRELKAIIELAAILSEGGELNETNIIFNRPNEMVLFDSKDLTLEEYNYKVIDHFMAKYNNRAILVARKLNISKSTIYRFLKKMNYKY